MQSNDGSLLVYRWLVGWHIAQFNHSFSSLPTILEFNSDVSVDNDQGGVIFNPISSSVNSTKKNAKKRKRKQKTAAATRNDNNTDS